jgi:hypothetical protein
VLAGRLRLVAGWLAPVAGRADLLAGWRGLVAGWRGLVAGWRGLLAGWADLLAGPADLAGAGPALAGVLLAVLPGFDLAGVVLAASAISSLVSNRTLPVESKDRFSGRLAATLPARCLAVVAPLAFGRL